MSVDSGKAAVNSNYGGKIYYFCSQDCKKKFDRNSAQYAKK
jgi:YHS domain-containing protein